MWLISLIKHDLTTTFIWQNHHIFTFFLTCQKTSFINFSLLKSRFPFRFIEWLVCIYECNYFYLNSASQLFLIMYKDLLFCTFINYALRWNVFFGIEKSNFQFKKTLLSTQKFLLFLFFVYSANKKLYINTLEKHCFYN